MTHKTPYSIITRAYGYDLTSQKHGLVESKISLKQLTEWVGEGWTLSNPYKTPAGFTMHDIYKDI